MPTAEREGLREALAEAFERRFPLTKWQAEAHAAAFIAGPLAPILAQADTAAQAVAERDEYAEYIIDLECKATRDAGQIDRLSAEVERLRAEPRAHIAAALARIAVIQARELQRMDPSGQIPKDLEEAMTELRVARTALAAGQDKEGGKPSVPSTDAPAAAQEGKTL